MNEVMMWVCSNSRADNEFWTIDPAKKGCSWYKNGFCRGDKGIPCDAKKFVAERVGRWIVTTYDSGNKTHECSACHRLFTGEPVDKPYCNCGARMEVLK